MGVYMMSWTILRQNTLFAPTDKAFGNLPEGTVEALLDDIPALSNILLFHVTGGAVYSKSLEDGGSVDMANGGKSFTDRPKYYKIFQYGPGNSDKAKPKVVKANRKVYNGVIHAVNEVL